MAAIEKFLTNFIVQRPALLRALQPAASWYVNASGYRKLGLRFDDLLSEECEVGNMAMKRLSPAQTYERVFRLRRAMQYSLMQKILPENEWTTDEEVRERIGIARG